MDEKILKQMKEEVGYWKWATFALTLLLGVWIVYATWALPVPKGAPPSYSAFQDGFHWIIGIMFLVLVMAAHLYGYYHGQINAREDKCRSNSAIIVESVTALVKRSDRGDPPMLN